MTQNLLFTGVNYKKNSYLKNYLKKRFFGQAYCLNYFSSHNSFLLLIYEDTVRLLAWHIKF